MSIFSHVKEAALLVSIALAAPAIALRGGELGLGLSLAFFGCLLLLCWIAVAFAAYTQNKWLRWVWAGLLAAANYTVLVYEHASGQFMTYDVFITMLYSAGDFDHALRQNSSAFLSALVPTVVLAAAITIKPRRSPPIPPRVLARFPWFVLAALIVMLFVRGGDGARGLPSGLTGTAYSALALYEEAMMGSGPRLDLIARPAKKPLVSHVVLIVDESIAPSYLAINDPLGVRTPLSNPPTGIAAHDFGVGAAITGCSAGVNVTLRHGGTREAYAEINAHYPTVWAYAQAAGMRTYYLDAQRDGGSTQSHMDAQELAQIDEFTQFDDVPMVNRDIAVARELAKLLADPEPKFIYVNKLGAHFPVQDKFPDSMMVYRPVLPRGAWTDITDTGDRTGFGGTPEDWRLYRNSYRNTLSWNVGEFFEVLFAEADLSRATLVYTSDHGQLLHEEGQLGLTTHCSAQPPHHEGAVPLLAIEGNGASGLDWERWAAANHDRSSHYMIFPTLLQLMGYERNDIAETYGKSLIEPSSDPMTFNRLFNARLGRDPVWMEVDPKNLPRPPASDQAAN